MNEVKNNSVEQEEKKPQDESKKEENKEIPDTGKSTKQDDIQDDVSAEDLEAFVEDVMKELEKQKKQKVHTIVLGYRLHANLVMDFLLQYVFSLLPLSILFMFRFPHITLTYSYDVFILCFGVVVIEYILNVISYRLFPKQMLFSFGLIAYVYSVLAFFLLALFPIYNYSSIFMLMGFVFIFDIFRFILKYAFRFIVARGRS